MLGLCYPRDQAQDGMGAEKEESQTKRSFMSNQPLPCYCCCGHVDKIDLLSVTISCFSSSHRELIITSSPSVFFFLVLLLKLLLSLVLLLSSYHFGVFLSIFLSLFLSYSPFLLNIFWKEEASFSFCRCCEHERTAGCVVMMLQEEFHWYTFQLNYPERLGILKKIGPSIEVFSSNEVLLDFEKCPYQSVIDYLNTIYNLRK